MDKLCELGQKKSFLILEGQSPCSLQCEDYAEWYLESVIKSMKRCNVSNTVVAIDNSFKSRSDLTL